VSWVVKRHSRRRGRLIGPELNWKIEWGWLVRARSMRNHLDASSAAQYLDGTRLTGRLQIPVSDIYVDADWTARAQQETSVPTSTP
jgi:hypothetical protein